MALHEVIKVNRLGLDTIPELIAWVGRKRAHRSDRTWNPAAQLQDLLAKALKIETREAHLLNARLQQFPGGGVGERPQEEPLPVAPIEEARRVEEGLLGVRQGQQVNRSFPHPKKLFDHVGHRTGQRWKVIEKQLVVASPDRTIESASQPAARLCLDPNIECRRRDSLGNKLAAKAGVSRG